MESFSDTFNCPKGTNYNPENRCQVNLCYLLCYLSVTTSDSEVNLCYPFYLLSLISQSLLPLNTYLSFLSGVVSLELPCIWSLFWQPLCFNKDFNKETTFCFDLIFKCASVKILYTPRNIIENKRTVYLYYVQLTITTCVRTGTMY